MNLNQKSTKPPEDSDKKKFKEKLKELTKEISKLQNILFAENKRSLLIIFQGLDASGKDGAIKNVFSEVNPQGINVTSFKVPTDDELSHDFLWRIHLHSPPKRMIYIFNRSYYEDVVVTRVKNIIDENTAEFRYKMINNFEELLKGTGTYVLKFFLHVSKEEQDKRLSERLDNPEKKWKYNASDKETEEHRDEHLDYYSKAIKKCSEHFPWLVIPSDKNWYKEYAVANETMKVLEGMKLKYPERTN